MKLSRKSEYALLALIELARKYKDENVVSAEQIAQHYDIPKKFLEVILAELKSHELVQVSRGAHGGYRLARDPEEIAVADIVRILDGPIAPITSVSVHFYHSSPLEKEAKTTHLFKNIRDYTSDMLEHTSLQDLL